MPDKAQERDSDREGRLSPACAKKSNNNEPKQPTKGSGREVSISITSTAGSIFPEKTSKIRPFSGNVFQNAPEREHT